MKVRMFDLNGRMIYQSNWDTKTDLIITTEHLKNGTYIIEGFDGVQKYYHKLQILHE